MLECYIHKDNKELRLKLQELGYPFIEGNVDEGDCLCITERLFINRKDKSHYKIEIIPYFTKLTEEKCVNKHGIDCGNNEELFLIYASMK